MGDFNEIQFDSEKLGGARKSWRQMNEFREAMEESGLEDMGCLGPVFTWSSKREDDAMILERLDRGLCNKDWKLLFPNSNMHHLDFGGSDHCPLLLEVKKTVSIRNVGCNTRRNRRFFFEECWVEEKEC